MISHKVHLLAIFHALEILILPSKNAPPTRHLEMLPSQRRLKIGRVA
jgi:hypothetical protein